MSLIVICGATATGKSDLAVALAKEINAEIVNADSMQVYKGMDIGTAKPSKAEQAEVVHHLIDVLDPSQNYSAAQFASDAKELISAIKQRGNIPLIVGGTMLYWRAWVYGFSNLPAANPEVRAQLDREAAEIGWPAMHAKLAILDPASAERLQPNDSQRVQRALEVFALTGRPLSDLFEETPSLAGRKQEPTPDWVEVISLEPSDRKTLHTRLEQRFDQMLESKFIEEVEQLRNRGDLHTNLPAIRSVGYRQVWEYLAGDIDFETMKEKAYAATRQLSKRQMTWLRAMDRRVFDPFDTKQMDLAQKQCLALLQ
jgi:tRNA dimethylallyltransferase